MWDSTWWGRQAVSLAQSWTTWHLLAEWPTLNWLLSISDDPNHSLHTAISRQRSSFSERLLSLSYSNLQTEEINPPPWHLALQQLTGKAIKQRRALDNVENCTYILYYPHHTSWTQRNTFTYWTLVCTKCVCVCLWTSWSCLPKLFYSLHSSPLVFVEEEISHTSSTLVLTLTLTSLAQVCFCACLQKEAQRCMCTQSFYLKVHRKGNNIAWLFAQDIIALQWLIFYSLLHN